MARLEKETCQLALETIEIVSKNASKRNKWWHWAKGQVRAVNAGHRGAAIPAWLLEAGSSTTSELLKGQSRGENIIIYYLST